VSVFAKGQAQHQSESKQQVSTASLVTFLVFNWFYHVKKSVLPEADSRVNPEGKL